MSDTLDASAYRARLSESAFQDSVRATAERLGWLVYHTHDSRCSDAGWPDLAMVRGNRLLLAELKKIGGRVRPEQELWLGALRQTPNEVYLWTPDDWDAIEEVLR